MVEKKVKKPIMVLMASPDDESVIKWLEISLGRHYDITFISCPNSDMDLVVFSGGTDICTSLYGESRNKYTEHPDTMRDLREMDLINYCKERSIKMLGICRGMQLLTVAAGGKLIQHVPHHDNYQTHRAVSWTGEFLYVNSYHHQVVYPWNMKDSDYNVLLYASDLSPSYIGEKNKNENLPVYHCDVEAIHLKKINALGFQYHPEWSMPGVDLTNRTQFKSFTNSVLADFINDSLPQFCNAHKYEKSIFQAAGIPSAFLSEELANINSSGLLTAFNNHLENYSLSANTIVNAITTVNAYNDEEEEDDYDEDDDNYDEDDDNYDEDEDTDML